MFKVTAEVRRVGAIGVFYPRTFEVDACTLEEAKEIWFACFSELWELRRFIEIAIDTSME